MAYGQGTIGGKPAGTHWPLAGEGAPLAAKRTASLPSETLWMAMLIVMSYWSRPLTRFTGGGLDGRQLALVCDKAFQRWRRNVLGGLPGMGNCFKRQAPVACPVNGEEEEGGVRLGRWFNGKKSGRWSLKENCFEWYTLQREQLLGPERRSTSNVVSKHLSSPLRRRRRMYSKETQLKAIWYEAS